MDPNTTDISKVLKSVLTVEKIVNIHRDYVHSTMRKRVLLTFLILFDVTISIIMLIYVNKLLTNVTGVRSVEKYTELIFYTLYIFQSLLVLYNGARFGDEFNKLLISLSSCHEFVRGHPQYHKNLLRIKFMNLFRIICFAIGKTTLLVQGIIFMNYVVKLDLGIFRYVLIFFVEFWCEARNVLGILIYFSLVAIIGKMLKAVNTLIMFVNHEGTLESNLHGFAFIYRQLLETSRRLKKCFGYQILVSLFIAASHFVSISYTLFNYILTKKDYSVLMWVGLWYHIPVYGAIFVIVAINGQEVRNEGMKLIRILAQIRNNFTDLENEIRKTVQDFHHLVSIEPITIELLPTMPVGMYLLPAVLSLTINYIIVSLQINHDI